MRDLPLDPFGHPSLVSPQPLGQSKSLFRQSNTLQRWSKKEAVKAKRPELPSDLQPRHHGCLSSTFQSRKIDHP
ncbi:hypothetical protein BO70DRAFT_160969 [Aspergillus heteromorphus CBS 117.55]|uniref:Uncharacterized protein n=1 Tax=Aspergillus heteromorphus CBS 117.55 TaxID=1448321 RepID=A0A317WRJ9_9EURO|nr:uncharacterized protein BO70DRAFT_160969 [Aspergillus heteromorphus CBS 117.55]PWY89083.1 hypothetical protein BO70DRAFT_160969 [Aspergillus heteromorphus CBS 117.55]